jgi:two-component system copper resistance phosphate regulon response regulator CusR
MKVLYVEDDDISRDYVQQGLTRQGLVVDVAKNGTIGLERAETGVYDVIVLDVMLPDFDGFELLRRLRSSGIDTPTIFLSARGEVNDRIQGLDLGADDYLAKPFAFAELLLRIRSLARRRPRDLVHQHLRVADLELDLGGHKVRRSGTVIDLSPKQFALLEYLMRNAGFALTRSMIIEKVWGYGFETRSNAIDVQISYLRNKIDAGFEPRLIHTVKGVGYILEDRSGEEHAA